MVNHTATRNSISTSNLPRQRRASTPAAVERPAALITKSASTTRFPTTATRASKCSTSEKEQPRSSLPFIGPWIKQAAKTAYGRRQEGLWDLVCGKFRDPEER